VLRTLLPEHFLALDDAGYSDMAADMAAGRSAAWETPTRFLYQRTATFLIPLSLLYKVVGPSPLAGSLFVALLGAGAAAVAALLVLRPLGTGGALLAGGVVALLPSQVAWSATTLKDAAVWLVEVTVALVVAAAWRASPRRAAAALTIGGTVGLVLLGHLRVHSVVVAGWAMALAFLFSPRGRRWLTALALAVAVGGLWVSGAGLAGIGVFTAATRLEELRAAGAEGANSAIPSDPNGWLGEAAYLPRGLAVILFEPSPWYQGDGTRVGFARIDTLLWYPLLPLALVGAVSVVRRHHSHLYVLIATGATAVMYAMAEGNVGTAFRHRGELVWGTAVLAAFGVEHLRERARHA
jgi:hypothetical protein